MYFKTEMVTEGGQEDGKPLPDLYLYWKWICSTFMVISRKKKEYNVKKAKNVNYDLSWKKMHPLMCCRITQFRIGNQKNIYISIFTWCGAKNVPVFSTIFWFLHSMCHHYFIWWANQKMVEKTGTFLAYQLKM